MKLPQCYEVEWEAEYKFHPTRKWRFDYAIPKFKIAVEIEGGVWVKGRHINPIGYTKDCEKYNAAACMGWVVLRYTTDMAVSNPISDDVLQIIHERLKT